MEDVGSLFGDERVALEDDGVVCYGQYRLNVAPKEGRANTLLADQLFSPALLLAEQIELGRVPVAGRTVLELGAGTGLPSLLAVAHGAAKVVASDYPDDLILRTLESNVAKAGVRVAPFAWGGDPAPLLQLASHRTDSASQSSSSPAQDAPSEEHVQTDKSDAQLTQSDAQPTHSDAHPAHPSPHTPPPAGFDTLILSDLLHFASSHPELLASLCALLKRSREARVYVACGRYTRDEVCAGFVEGAAARGVVLVEWDLRSKKEGGNAVGGGGGDGGVDGGEEGGDEVQWEVASTLRGVDREGMSARKRNCRLWEGRWVNL